MKMRDIDRTQHHFISPRRRGKHLSNPMGTSNHKYRKERQQQNERPTRKFKERQILLAIATLVIGRTKSPIPTVTHKLKEERQI